MKIPFPLNLIKYKVAKVSKYYINMLRYKKNTKLISDLIMNNTKPEIEKRVFYLCSYESCIFMHQ